MYFLGKGFVSAASMWSSWQSKENKERSQPSHGFVARKVLGQQKEELSSRIYLIINTIYYYFVALERNLRT